MRAWNFVLMSCGASLAAGTITKAYPDFAWLGPLLGYIAGAAMVLGLRLRLPMPRSRRESEDE